MCTQLELSDIQSCRLRSLFDWHYAEHHNASIFPQVTCLSLFLQGFLCQRGVTFDQYLLCACVSYLIFLAKHVNCVKAQDNLIKAKPPQLLN